MKITINNKKKSKFPFKLGCTSYVYPENIIPNVKKMSVFVDDIELVLFESEEISNLPSIDDISELLKIANENDITYSIHFPIDKKAGSENLEESNYFLSQILKIIKITSSLPISGYILHLEGITSKNTEKEFKFWEKRITCFLDQLFLKVSIPSQMFCLENLGYSVDFIKKIQIKYNLSICLDIGHLILYESEWRKLLTSFNTVRIVHLHGVSECKDHISLKKMNNSDMQYIFDNFINTYTGVLTLEVFSKEDTFESIQRIEDLWQKL